MELAIRYLILLVLISVGFALVRYDFREKPATPNRLALTPALILGIPALMFGLSLPTWWAFMKVIREGHGDFRMLYSAGWIVRMGESSRLYDYGFQKFVQDTHIGVEQIALPFNHLGFEALFFVPFTYLNYPTAWVAFLLLNLALLAGIVRLMRPHLAPLNRIYPWASAALTFTYLPVTATLLQGQDSILILLLLVLCWDALQVPDRNMLAGSLLAVGFFRFQIILPIVVLFLLWRKWKVAIGFLLTVVPVLAISVSLVGINGAKEHLRLLLAAASQSGSFAQGVNPSSMANFRGLCFGLHLPFLVLVALSAGLLYLASRTQPSMELAIAVTVLVSYHGLIHDMCILLIPALASLARNQVRGWLLLVAPIVMAAAPSQFYFASVPVLVFALGEIFASPSYSRSRARAI